ncbi:PREDICTED: protein Smaug homolog 1-like [Priapulus caudatus]|uniref:Protein Smaug homolog 1-like n=1 Tax=Priapulus caudatus TaxID=37621 RepID=A0ABM1DZ45_PRICU|nr:PREDICTED: protein Smaug homolog 1-like [Priapulus caudatus]
MRSPTSFMFRDQVNGVTGCFLQWNACEQVVALVSLLKKLQPTQARFLGVVLQHDLADSAELRVLEQQANNPDVPLWLKSLRLHKYSHLFSKMTYEEMMGLSEKWLETQLVTKGARHKIYLSIQKLKERQRVLRAMENDVLEGANLRNALAELRAMLNTPAKAYTATAKAGVAQGSPPPSPGAGDADAPGQVAEGDLPGQFTRVMGKVCTQLLVSSRPDDENFSIYLQLIDRCLNHEAFTVTQKKRLQSWKQQVQKSWRPPQQQRNPGRGPPPRGFPPQFSAAASFPADFKLLPPGVSPGVMRASRRLPGQVVPRMPFPKQGLVSLPLATLQRPFLSQSFNKPRPANLDKGGIQRTKSAPTRPPPQPAYSLFQRPESDFSVGSMDHDINNRLESLCLSVTEHALADGAERSSTGY